MITIYKSWLNAIEHENNLLLIKSKQFLTQLRDLESRLRDVKLSLHLNHENNKSNKTNLSNWRDIDFLLERNEKALRSINRRLKIVEKNHAHVRVAQQYFLSTNIQLKKLNRNIQNIRMYLRSSMIYDNRNSFDMRSTISHINKSFVNFNNTQRFITIVQKKYVKALRRSIIKNNVIMIDFVETIFKSDSLSLEINSKKIKESE